MTDTISGLSKWTKEKLLSEVMQLRNQRRESFNLANKNQDNNQELDRLKLEFEHQKEFFNQAQSEIQFLRSQNDKLISNLISEKNSRKRCREIYSQPSFLSNVCSSFHKTVNYF